jgi:peptidoglycan/LPS O-acetylase OafA/YrhL
MFYKNVIKIEYWGDTPFHYCNILISLLVTLLISSIIHIFLLLSFKSTFIDIPPLFLFIIGMVIFLVSKRYYKYKERELIIEISKKSKTKKVVIYVLSFFVFLLIFLLTFYIMYLVRNNNSNIY